MFDVNVLRQVFPNLKSLDGLVSPDLQASLEKSTVLVALNSLRVRAERLQDDVFANRVGPHFTRWRCRCITEDLQKVEKQARALGMYKNGK